jgi:hypothetical protein
MAVRLLDGYELTSLRLALPTARPAFSQTDVGGPNAKVKEYVAALPIAAGIDRAWFDLNPPAASQSTLPDLLQRLIKSAQERGGNGDLAIYVWNTNWLNNMACTDDFAKLSDRLLTFSPPDNDIQPVFRLFGGVTFGYAYFNRFGFRGPELDFKKPRRTLRIAFAGSSTVVDDYGNHFSYPEYVVNWLNVWAEQSGRDVKFEVINGGRSGFPMPSIEKTVTEQILPLSPDLVVLDATAQPLHPTDVVKLGSQGDVIDIDSGLKARREAALGHGLVVADYSAAGRRLYDAISGSDDGPELPTPKQSLVWPAGVNEQEPDPDAQNLPMGLPSTIQTFDRIQRSTSAAGAEIAVISSMWLTDPALKLDVIRNWRVFEQINQLHYPMSLSSINRALQFQNRVFAAYAQRRGIPYFDVQTKMPVDADLFSDDVHTREDGTRIRAWLIFNQLMPFVVAKLESGVWPREAAPATVDEETAFPRPKLAENPCFIKTGKRVFSLITDPSESNYKAQTTDTRIELQPDGLLVTSNQSKLDYQLATDAIHVDPGKTYVIAYAYKLLQGKMQIGILSKGKDRFLLSRILSSPDLQHDPELITFETPEDAVTLVVSNGNDEPAVSRLKLRKLELYEAAPVSNRTGSLDDDH